MSGVADDAVPEVQALWNMCKHSNEILKATSLGINEDFGSHVKHSLER